MISKTVKKLPEGWKEVYLHEICQVLTGFAFDSNLFNNEENGKPIIRIRDLQTSQVKTYYSGDYDEKYLVHKGNFLISMDGEFKIFEWKSADSLLNQRVCKLTLDNNKVIPKYIYYIISKKLKEIEDKTPFVTVKHISNKQILSIRIILPSITIQEQFVSILEKAEKLKQKREEADKLTKEYLQSVFYGMFLKTKHPHYAIRNGLLKTVNKNPSADFPDDYFEYLDIASIDNNLKKISGTKKVLGKEAPSRARQQMRYKDILVSTVRPNLNAVALIPRTLNDQICSTGFCILRADNKTLMPEYLFLITQQNFFVNKLVEKCKGANYPAVSFNDIVGLEIPLPPLPLQQKFGKIVEQVEKLKEKQKHSKEKIDNLFNALMQKAFKGELNY